MLRMLEVTTLLESVAWFLSVMMMTTCPRYMHLKQLHRGKRCYLQQMGSSYAASKLGKTPTSGRGRGRGKASGNLKQMTLDGSLGFHGSNRSASLAASASVRSIADEENVDSASSDEIEQLNVNDVKDSSGEDQSLQGKGHKRAGPRGRGRGSTTSKRGRKSVNSSLNRMFTSRDDDDVPKRFNTSQPKAPKTYSSLRRQVG